MVWQYFSLYLIKYILGGQFNSSSLRQCVAIRSRETRLVWVFTISTCVVVVDRLQYEPKKFCHQAAECGRPLRATNCCLPPPSGNGGERQTPVIFTPRAVLNPMLQTMMDPGTSLPVIPVHESQVTAVRLTCGNSFRSLHMYALCTLYTGRIK